MAALAIRDGVVPATVGLVDPEVDGLDRYVTESNHPKHPATVLALTATAGSVRGGVLLAGAR